MADFAKLNLVVAASGVEDAKAQLEGLANTGELTGKQLLFMGGSSDKASEAMDKHSSSAGSLSRVLHMAAAETGAFGYESARVAGLISSFGPVGAVATGAVVTLAAAYKVVTAESKAFTAEMTNVEKIIRQGSVQELTQHIIELKDVLTSREGISGFFLEIAQRAKGIFSGGLGAISNTDLAAAQAQIEEGLYGKQKASINEINRSIRDQIDLIGKDAPDAIRIQGAALERDLINKYVRAGDTLAGATEKAKTFADALTSAKLVEDLKTRYDATQKLTQATLDLYEAQRKAAEAAAWTAARGSVTSGKTAVTKFEQDFGVTMPVTQMFSAHQMAQDFAVVFNQFKDDPTAQGALNEAFRNLIDKGVKEGWRDVPELLSSVNISSRDLMNLTATLEQSYPALKAQVDATIEVGQQWGPVFRDAGAQATQTFATIGAAAETFAYNTNEAIDSVIQRLYDLPNIERTIVYRVYFAESPARPFSELLPTMKSRFSSLDDLVKNSTPDITMEIPNFNETLAKIQMLQQNLTSVYAKWNAPVVTAGIAGLVTNPPNFPNPYADLYRNEATQIQAQIADLTASLLSQANKLGQAAGTTSTGGGGGSGGTVGGGAVVNIDLRGSSLYPEAIDNMVIPALERALIRTTGQDPSFRITN